MREHSPLYFHKSRSTITFLRLPASEWLNVSRITTVQIVPGEAERITW